MNLFNWAPAFAGVTKFKERRRLEAFIPLLAQDLEILASALRAGSSFIQAINVAAQENQGPLADEWIVLMNEIQHGASLRQALSHLEQRIPIASIHSFSSIVTITQATGGNMAGVLSNLAETLRQTITFQNKLRAMTAQGKLSGYVVSAMPFFIMGVLGWLTPDLMQPLFRTTSGWLMLSGVVVMVTIGTWMIQKIVTIDV